MMNLVMLIIIIIAINIKCDNVFDWSDKLIKQLLIRLYECGLVLIFTYIMYMSIYSTVANITDQSLPSSNLFLYLTL